MNNTILTVNRKPTIDDACGSYKHVDDNGIYWGHWYIGFTWDRVKFIAEADPRDGKPW